MSGLNEKLRHISRRDLFKLSGKFGLSSTLLAASSMAGVVTLPSLAKAVESTYDKRFGNEPKYTLKYGASGFNNKNTLIERVGCLEFARDLEERTDGLVRVEFIGDNQICGQLNCVEKTQLGIVDIYTASTQNSAGGAPYLNVLDYAYMFPGRASQYHFFYSPESQRILRDPLEKRHGLKFLFTHCELRGIQLGLKYSDKPVITRLDELFGTKNRVTGTQLGRIAMQLLNLNPVPIAWEETLDGLKQGLIDGAETWASAVAYANMAPVVSQSVDLKFFCGTEHTSMNAKVFDSFEPEVQDAVMESSYFTQGVIQGRERGVAGQHGRLLRSAAPQYRVRGQQCPPGLPRRRPDQDGGGNVLAGIQSGALGTVARAPQQVGRRHRHLYRDQQDRAPGPGRYEAGKRRAPPLVEELVSERT